MEIQIDEEVKQYIMSQKTDFRICTACMGPALVPVKVKGPKANDIKVPIGEQTLYISKVQARYIDRVTMDMLYDKEDIDSCPAFYTRRAW